MAGPGGQVHKGWRRHMRWARESSWGNLPPAPDWHCIPIRSGVMTLKARANLFDPSTSFTNWRRNVLLPELQEVAGQIEVLAWPEVTGYLLDAALERDANHDLQSYCVDYFTPPDPRRCLGVVVERLRIRADRESVALLLEARAWKEQENDVLAEDDFDYSALTPTPFRLRDAAITLDGSGLTDVGEFAIVVDNAVEAGPRSAGGYVAFLIAGLRSVSLEVAKLDNADDFNAAIRSGATMSFAAGFTHPEGHEMTLELPRLHVERSDEDGLPSRVARSRAVLQATTDESDVDLAYQVNLAGQTTTTTAAS